MTLALAELRRDIAHAFGLDAPAGPELLGLEVEGIPVELTTGRPLSVARSLDALAALGWARRYPVKGNVPELRRPDGARLTFEPGGQVEYSSAPHASGSALLADVENALESIAGALAANGAALMFAGLDPHTPIDDVPLQLDAERYRRMDAWFASQHAAGRRMMRQTASMQLCVSVGADPLARWRLLARLAPVAAAMFANSPLDGGAFTGERSRRRRIWAELDPARTGLRALGADPVDEYVRFALAAPAFLLGDDPTRAEPFERWIARGATHAEWLEHLSTLFPDVRPRGYFEFRVPDAVGGDALPALVALVAGVVWHAPATAAAIAALPAPDEALMARAGRDALADATLAGAAHEATLLALDGCRALGAALLQPHDVSRARRFFDRYPLAGRAPADDVHASVAA